MYKVQVAVNNSDIAGRGVFARQNIVKGTMVWVFTHNNEIEVKVSAHDALPQKTKDRIDKTGYLSPWTSLWIFPPENDPARFTNHSRNNNLSVAFDKSISPEPYFVANRNIKSGEELTNNYHEFDQITRQIKPDWAA
jgi:uncharacterized protein